MGIPIGSKNNNILILTEGQDVWLKEGKGQKSSLCPWAVGLAGWDSLFENRYSFTIHDLAQASLRVLLTGSTDSAGRCSCQQARIRGHKKMMIACRARQFYKQYRFLAPFL